MSDTWKIIIAIAGNFITTLAAGLILSRRSQPKPMPDTNHPQAMETVLKSLVGRIISSPWLLPPLWVLLNIHDLYWEMIGTSPISRRVILGISAHVAFILFNIAIMGVLIALEGNSRFLELFGTHVREENYVHIQTLNVVTALGNTLTGLIEYVASKREPESPLQTVLRKQAPLNHGNESHLN
jgi:hypothetical protein